MKSARRWISLFLTAMLATAGLAGCKSGRTATGSSSAVSGGEPVKISILAYSTSQFKPDDPVAKELQKEANVTLSIETPTQGSYDEKVSLLISSGAQLPDVVNLHNSSSTLFSQARSAGVIIPITKYFNDAKNLKKMLNPRAIAAVTLKGEVMAIPKCSFDFAPGVMVRLDWLKKLGIKDYPTDGSAITTDKLVEILKGFSTGDPDGDGKNDTYGLDYTAPKDPTSWVALVPKCILNAFGAGRGWVKNSSGKLENTDLTTEWDKYKKALSFYKSLFDQKLVNPDILMTTTDTIRDRFYKGQTGMVASFGSAGSYANFITPMRQVNPNVDLVYFSSIKGPSGDFVDYFGGSGMTDTLAVTKYCKNVKAVVDFFDFCATSKGYLLTHAGLEGQNYTLQDNVPMRLTDAQKTANTEFSKWKNSIDFVRNYKLWDMSYDVPNLGEAGQYYKKMMDTSMSSSYVKYNDDYGYRAPSKDQLQDLDRELENTEVKYLTGAAKESDLDAVRNKYIASSIYKQWVTEENDWYKDNIAAKK